MLQTHLSVFLGNQANVKTKLLINPSQTCTCQRMNTYFWVWASKTFTVKLNSAQAGSDQWWIWWQQTRDLPQEVEGRVIERYAAISAWQMQGDIRWSMNFCAFPWVNSLGFSINISAVATDSCHSYVPTSPACGCIRDRRKMLPAFRALVARVTQGTHPGCRPCVREKTEKKEFFLSPEKNGD